MNARKLFYHKETRDDIILQMVIWQLPEKTTTAPRIHAWCAMTMKRAKAIIAIMAIRRRCILFSR